MAPCYSAGVCVLAGDAALCLAGADQYMESDICYAGEVFYCTDGDFIAGLSDLYPAAQVSWEPVGWIFLKLNGKTYKIVRGTGDILVRLFLVPCMIL